MIRRHAQGATLAEIARRYNLTVEEVQRVVYPHGVRAELVKRKYDMSNRDARNREQISLRLRSRKRREQKECAA